MILLVLLAVPLGHVLLAHRSWLRRLGRPSPLTEHERKHALKSPGQKAMTDLAWLMAIAMVLVVSLIVAR